MALKRLAVPFGMLVLIALHIPFLQADPDGLLAWHSRGAYTDEGLYTSQIRNLVNHGDFHVDETDGFAKAPLFSVYLLPFIALGISHLWLARLAILLFFSFSLYSLLKKHISRGNQLFAVGITGLQYLVFHYSHFAMAEMLAASFILWILYFYLHYVKEQQPRYIIYAALCSVAAFLTKTNNLYVVGILPTVLTTNLLYGFIKKDTGTKAKALFYSIATTVAGLAATFLFVYLPNKALYLKIYNQEVAGKFEPTTQQIISRAGFNWTSINNEPVLFFSLSILLYLTIMALIGYFIKANKNTSTITTNNLLLFSGIWLLIELHKLPVLNLPSRYLVSSFLVVSITSVGIIELLSHTRLRILAKAMALLLVLFGAIAYRDALNRRSYTIHNLNQYIKATGQTQPMLGTWAPTACWQGKNITMPVWENYFNDYGFIEKHRPVAIITEVDERDAESVFAKRGINLKQLSDSIRVFRIAEWDVAVHWLKK